MWPLTLFQELQQDLKSEEGEVDDVSEDAQMVSQTTGESRPVSFTSQLSSRYQTLLVTLKVTTATHRDQRPPYMCP